MVSSSHDYIKKSSSEIEFVVEVPADEKAVVCFEYRIDRRLEITLKR